MNGLPLGLSADEEAEVGVGEGGDEEQAVEAVEDAAMAGQDAAEVFDAFLALQGRLEQVAGLAGHGSDEAQDEAVNNGKADPGGEGRARHHAADQAAEGALN